MAPAKPIASAVSNQVPLPIEKKPAVREYPNGSSTNAGGTYETNRPNPGASNQSSTAGEPGGFRGAGLDLDQVVSDYLSRSADQQKLELKVLTPDVFTAGKSVGLKVQVSCGGKAESDAVVTIKVIGTAFKPQVYIGRSAMDGVASFSLVIPAFTAGTAAIVIECQSKHGRGEVKQLIRRS